MLHCVEVVIQYEAWHSSYGFYRQKRGESKCTGVQILMITACIVNFGNFGNFHENVN